MQIPVFGKVRRPSLWLLSLIALGILGLGAAALVAIRNRGSAYDVEAFTIPAETSALTVRITASGTVEPIQTVNLSPKASGILEALYVEQGDRVTQGQLIAQMESRELEAQRRLREAAVAEATAQLADIQRGTDREEIAQAEAAVQSAEAQVRDAQARLNLAEAQMTRNRQLQSQGAISQNELDNFDQAARSARASLESAQFQARETSARLADLNNEPRQEDIAQAEARLAQSQAQLEAVEIQIADTQVRAPFAGIITQKFANEGAIVTPTTSASDASSATSTAIVTLASELEVLAEVAETDIAAIRPGQAVEIIADAFPDQTFQGQVRIIAPEAIERQNVTLFQVRIDLSTGQSVLLSNMNATVAFIGEQITDALVVPKVAVVTQEGEAGVLIPTDRDQIRFRPVTLGAETDTQIQITEGLAEGDRVFIDLPPTRNQTDPNFKRDVEDET
ncbi:MAG: efflux RND transporter periplasmic adaptor subunit [Cyanobacteria bacterium J06639_14]